MGQRRVASPVTATTDFLAPNFFDTRRRASPRSSALRRTLMTPTRRGRARHALMFTLSGLNRSGPLVAPHCRPPIMLKLRSIGLSDYSVLEGRQRIGRIRLATERMPRVWLWSVERSRRRLIFRRYPHERPARTNGSNICYRTLHRPTWSASRKMTYDAQH